MRLLLTVALLAGGAFAAPATAEEDRICIEWWQPVSHPPVHLPPCHQPPGGPVECAAIAAMTPGIPGVVDIDSEGDVSVAGEPVWDCPPYGS